MNVYSHAGDLGDLIGSLATIRQLTDTAELVLYPADFVREPWTPAKVERCRSFFEHQEYITGVRYADRPEGIVLDEWRKKYRRGLNLADMVCSAFDVPHWPRETPWCRVDDVWPFARVVMHRSPRYPGRGFPWKKIVKKYRADAVFVGSEDEHKEFVKLFGFVEYMPTETLLDLARVIAGCELYVSNQSAPMMLAEALKKPRWLEVCPRADNCRWERPDAWYTNRWPDLELKPY